jgi:hypothetical protein
MTAVAPDTSFATRVEVRAQSLFLAAIVAFGILAFGQLMSINRELGALNARMALIETQLRTLTQAVDRIAPK